MYPSLPDTVWFSSRPCLEFSKSESRLILSLLCPLLHWAGEKMRGYLFHMHRKQEDCLAKSPPPCGIFFQQTVDNAINKKLQISFFSWGSLLQHRIQALGTSEAAMQGFPVWLQGLSRSCPASSHAKATGLSIVALPSLCSFLLGTSARACPHHNSY